MRLWEWEFRLLGHHCRHWTGVPSASRAHRGVKHSPVLFARRWRLYLLAILRGAKPVELLRTCKHGMPSQIELIVLRAILVISRVHPHLAKATRGLPSMIPQPQGTSALKIGVIG